jgi:lipoic acid synthetase
MTLRVRWLGTVPYREALAVQQALFDRGRENHLLLLEHPHVFTHGPRADLATNVHVDPATVGAELVAVNRGGDVTYHGPGQLVGYPIVSYPGGRYASGRHVRNVEQLVIDTLTDLGVEDAGRLPDYPGVWVGVGGPDPRKICAIGVRFRGGRSMHGFALNVTTDLAYMRRYIVPCGIPDRPVTSLAEEGVAADMRGVVDSLVRRAGELWGGGAVDRQDVAWRRRPEDLSAFSRGEGPGHAVRAAADHLAAGPPDGAAGGGTSVRLLGRLERSGVTGGLAIAARKPDWLRPKVQHTAEVLAVRRTLRERQLVTVCEEAGCPNLSECWSSGTATFMILGERCTRACGFCLVDTRKPLAPDPDEPARVADAVEQMGLAHAVITMVARDDLDDGGAAAVAATVRAVHERVPSCAVEVLISDLGGDADDLATVLAARPEVVNHNVETVPRLQWAVRPSAGYARSLGLLGRAKAAGATTKSGLVVGMGETDGEVEATLADLAGIGVDIVTIGQYLRPTSNHLPVHRWVPPETFERYAATGRALGIGHVESSPLTRSSYHAREAAAGRTGGVLSSAVE